MTSVIERVVRIECKAGPGPSGRTYLATLKLIGDTASHPAEVVVSETVAVRSLSDEEWAAIARVKLEKLASLIKGDRAPGVIRVAIDYREVDDLLIEAKAQSLIP
jgi:hypothetical protein